jgi:hypothetical protein
MGSEALEHGVDPRTPNGVREGKGKKIAVKNV